jgi:hypothetical protein
MILWDSLCEFRPGLALFFSAPNDFLVLGWQDTEQHNCKEFIVNLQLKLFQLIHRIDESFEVGMDILAVLHLSKEELPQKIAFMAVPFDRCISSSFNHTLLAVGQSFTCFTSDGLIASKRSALASRSAVIQSNTF